MKRSATFLAILLAISLLFALASPAAMGGKKVDPEPNPDPGQDPEAVDNNLAFPVVMTEYLPNFYETEVIIDENGKERTVIKLDEDGNAFPLVVEESITHRYSGSYPGQTMFDYGAWLPCEDDPLTPETEYCEWVTMPLLDFLHMNAPWYPQPTGGYDNVWQAETAMTTETVEIDFIDWGNPLENINPTVGYRFPVEIALYQKLDESMTGYKVACLEYQSTRDELFGTSEQGGDSFTWEAMYATVLTNNFECWVIGPGGVRTDVVLEPAIGPSGKMNFASANGGWMPTQTGEHRIYFRVWDPNIVMWNADVNNDEHYCLSLGMKMEDLSWHKLELTGVYYNDTWIDVTVDPQNGGRRK